MLKVFLIKYKIQLVCQFLYFLLFYIASELTSADIIFNIYQTKIFEWIKYLNANTSKFILKCWERTVKRKSNISVRVIKNSSFDQCFLMVKTFLKILWCWFFFPTQHLLVSSVTLLCMTQNILTLSMLVYYNTNSFFLSFSLMHLLLVCSSSLIIKVLSEIHFEVSLFQVAP